MLEAICIWSGSQVWVVVIAVSAAAAATAAAANMVVVLPSLALLVAFCLLRRFRFLRLKILRLFLQWPNAVIVYVDGETFLLFYTGAELVQISASFSCMHEVLLLLLLFFFGCWLLQFCVIRYGNESCCNADFNRNYIFRLKKKLFLSSTLLVFYQLFCSMYFICVYLVSIDDEIEWIILSINLNFFQQTNMCIEFAIYIYFFFFK